MADEKPDAQVVADQAMEELLGTRRYSVESFRDLATRIAFWFHDNRGHVNVVFSGHTTALRTRVHIKSFFSSYGSNNRRCPDDVVVFLNADHSRLIEVGTGKSHDCSKPFWKLIRQCIWTRVMTSMPSGPNLRRRANLGTARRVWSAKSGSCHCNIGN